MPTHHRGIHLLDWSVITYAAGSGSDAGEPERETIAIQEIARVSSGNSVAVMHKDGDLVLSSSKQREHPTRGHVLHLVH